MNDHGPDLRQGVGGQGSGTMMAGGGWCIGGRKVWPVVEKQPCKTLGCTWHENRAPPLVVGGYLGGHEADGRGGMTVVVMGVEWCWWMVGKLAE